MCCATNRAPSSETSATFPLGARTTMCRTHQGRHRSTGESPKKHSIGLPSAAAMCMAPPSLQIAMLQAASPAMRSLSSEVGQGTNCARFDTISRIAAALSLSPGCPAVPVAPGDQKSNIAAPCLLCNSVAKSANCLAGQRWAVRRALMCIAMSGRVSPTLATPTPPRTFARDRCSATSLLGGIPAPNPSDPAA